MKEDNSMDQEKGRVVYMNGKYVSENEAKISIYDSALMFGDMVFEMTRSFNKKQRMPQRLSWYSHTPARSTSKPSRMDAKMSSEAAFKSP